MAITLFPDQHLIELLDRIAQQDEAALKELYDITSKKLYGLALKMVGQHEYAEEVLQECYLNVWRIACDYRASLSPPFGWMTVIVRSRALDLLRKLAAQPDTQRAWPNGRTQSVDEEQALELPSSDVGLLEGLMAGQTAQGLQNCLSQIEEQQRELIQWSYFRDMSHADLAAQFQLPLGTVKTWIRRGLMQLKSCMASFV